MPLDAMRLDFYEGAWLIKRYHKVNHRQDGLAFYFYQTRSPRQNLKPTPPQFALDLERVLGDPAEHWLSLQANYTLWLIRQGSR